MKNIGQLMKQAQQMQTRMAEMQAKLAEIEMSGQSGGGMVVALMNGKGELKKITLDKTAVDPDDVETVCEYVMKHAIELKQLLPLLHERK